MRHLIVKASLLWIGSFTLAGSVAAQDSSGFYTDPATGIVYRKVTRTIERPVVETKMTQRQQTVYKPKTVTETRPTTRRTYTPVTQHRWVPKVEGRWNPFVQPRVAYHHVPQTHWQANDEVVAETKTEVQWEPETQTVSVPQQLMRIAREQKVDFEPIGRVAPQASQVAASNVSPEIASRLRPLGESTSVQPLQNGSFAGNTNGMIARQNPRSTLQTGLRATELMPSSGTATVAPMTSGTANIAGLPPLRIWR
ncbi:hypothetical protein [Neorhodopirellula lusitana]|uniref:hypothetical protein n=1 Tax=Neorhodopirellula lusitana TaxID=445327 RepID=UPI00384E2766